MIHAGYTMDTTGHNWTEPPLSPPDLEVGGHGGP